MREIAGLWGARRNCGRSRFRFLWAPHKPRDPPQNHTELPATTKRVPPSRKRFWGRPQIGSPPKPQQSPTPLLFRLFRLFSLFFSSPSHLSAPIPDEVGVGLGCAQRNLKRLLPQFRRAHPNPTPTASKNGTDKKGRDRKMLVPKARLELARP